MQASTMITRQLLGSMKKGSAMFTPMVKLPVRTFIRSSNYLLDDGTNTQKGTVKWFDVKKGFGFIVPDDDGDDDEDIFVHQSAIHARGFRSLADGEEVEYEIHQDPRSGKLSAQNVTGPNGDFVQGAPKPIRRDSGDMGYGDY